MNELITDEPRVVLDVGCGRGDIARNLVDLVERVDAVDFSKHMLEEGKCLPNGNAPRLKWLYGDMEEVALNPPYALITAGESLHWLAWECVFPRFRQMLTSNGYVAIITRTSEVTEWGPAVFEVVRRYSTNQDFLRSYDLVLALEERELFQKIGVRQTNFAPFTLSVDEYIESTHSRNGFSREHMTAENAAAFDNEVRTILLPYAAAGLLTLQVGAQLLWGRPGTASEKM